MKFIAHRGNLNGPSPEKENHPAYVDAAFQAGFDAEVDVWVVDGKIVLGHDKPQYEIHEQWFYSFMMWVHCKNIEALYKFKSNPLINAFYHDQDDAVLTSQGYIWTFPRPSVLTKQSVAVMPERVKDWQLDDCYGICTDYPVSYKKDLKFKFSDSGLDEKP